MGERKSFGSKVKYTTVSVKKKRDLRGNGGSTKG
jgi:hypothetical protein